MEIDRRKTLTELEDKDWGPPTFDSHLVATIHQLRHKPLDEFTVEDLRITIGQNVGLKHLLPIALERLNNDPFTEGDFYRGDLLNAVLGIKPSFWSDYPELRRMVSEVVQGAEARRQELDEVEAEALEQGLKSFQLTHSSHPLPTFLPLQKVVVIERLPPDPGDGGILGEHGVIIWRTSCFVEKSRCGASGWLYVVHFPQPDAYNRIEESRLMPTGEDVPLANCLGRHFEISYDRDGSGPDAIGGTFRIPGGFWNTFEFRKAAVEEPSYGIRIPMRFYSSGIGKYDFVVPQAALLDCHYIEEAMSKVFEATGWQRISGPQSSWLC